MPNEKKEQSVQQGITRLCFLSSQHSVYAKHSMPFIEKRKAALKIEFGKWTSQV